MSAGIANSFIFRESYFAEEVLQYQTPSRIDEDEDNNAASSIDYIRKYVEQLTADVRLQSSSSSSPATTTPSTAPNAGSTLLLPPPPSSTSSTAATATATTTTTTPPPSTVSSSASTAAHAAAIIAFNFASIQVSPSSNSTSNNDTSASSGTAQHEDTARLENELDLPRYLSWFDEDALASDDEDEQDDDGEGEHQVIFYADAMADDEDDEINNDADGDIEMEVEAEEEEEEPLFVGQQAQLQLYEATKKYKQSLTPDASLSSSPSSWSTALSLLAQHCALPIESPQYDTMKRKTSDVVPSEQEKDPKKFKRRNSQRRDL